jgi:2-(1,2-epoxy-1,2-dihydrophenyl)acetyl-CoA isomerase
VGYSRALEIAAFDEPISSDQALNWGLVTKIVEDGQALNEAVAMAKQLAQRSVHSFGWAKKLITDSFDTSFESQLEKERAALKACADHPDGRKALADFSEKSKRKT